MTGERGRTAGVLVSAATRFRSRRRQSRRRVVVSLVVAALLTAGIGAGAWVAYESSAFALRTVTIEGTARVTVAQVLRAASLSRGTSLLRIDPATVAARVRRLPAVAQAVVTRSWPHGLVIRVIERKPAAVVTTPAGAVLLDAGGVAFATQATAPANLVRVSVGAPLPGPGAQDARAAMAVFSALPRPLRRRVAMLDAPSPDAVSFALTDGRVVVWGSPEQDQRKLVVLRALLRRPAHRYDVSAPDVAVTS